MRYIHKLIAPSLTMAMLSLSASFALGVPRDAVGARGTLKASGAVNVNELPALSGQTIFSGSHVVTASGSSSILELGNFTRLMMSEQTDLALDFSATSVSSSLRRGEVRAFIPASRTLSITTPDGVVATDSSQAVVFSVLVKPGFTHISVETGRVELRAGNNRRVVAAGETFMTDCDSFAVPNPLQHLGTSERGAIIAGIGVGLVSILVAIIGRNPKEEPQFGGCAIAPSGSNDPPPICF